MTHFQEKIAVAAFEALLVVLVVVIAGLVANFALERYKKRQSVLGEIAQLRVREVAKIWAELNAWNQLIEEMTVEFAALVGKQEEGLHISVVHTSLSRALGAIRDANLSDFKALKPEAETWQEKIGPLAKDSVQQAEKVRRLMSCQRFWLGEDLHDHCEGFVDLLADLCLAFDVCDLSMLDKGLSELEEARQSVQEVQEILMNETAPNKGLKHTAGAGA